MSCQIQFNADKCGIITQHKHVSPPPVSPPNRVRAKGVRWVDGDAAARRPPQACCSAMGEANGMLTGPVNCRTTSTSETIQVDEESTGRS